jgi:CRISPR-associated protein Cas1
MAVLYITKQGASLHKTGGRLVVKQGKNVLSDMPAISVDQVVLFGNIQVTTQAMAYLLKEGIDTSYLSSSGRFRGKLMPELKKDVTLRQQQLKIADLPQTRLAIAKSIVLGKLQNTIIFCKRQRGTDDEVLATIKSIQNAMPKVIEADNVDTLYGLEGAAAANYYKIFRKFLNVSMGFTGRQYRPPKDPINAMLSLGYTMLYNNVYAAINIVGLDPYCGFFHQPRHGHATLASDLMEEFRDIIVDSMVLSLVNRSQVKESDFQNTQKGVRLSKDALSLFLSHYNGRINHTLIHPSLNVRTTYLKALEQQVRRLTRVILGEEKQYVPFKAQK